MGEVYRALDTRLDRIVAIKILPSHLSENPDAKERFDREARTISSLNHPNICTLYDVGHQNGVDYLVMEYLEGETLASRLDKGALAPDQVLKYGIEICEGLEVAHRTGVVHRDLKPGNIMLTKTGVKLMDFGLAKSLPARTSATPSLTMTLSSPAANSPLTEKGMLVGTFQYMSPEQVQGKEVDGRSDIFSLGAVLYEMVTGKRAFEGKSQLSVAAAIVEDEPAPIASVKPMTSAVLDHSIVSCLAKNPEDRWQTARDLALELKWTAGSGGRDRNPHTSEPKKIRPTVACLDRCGFAGRYCCADHVLVSWQATTGDHTSALRDPTACRHSQLHTLTRWSPTGLSSARYGWPQPCLDSRS